MNSVQTKTKVLKEKLLRVWGALVSASTQNLFISSEKKKNKKLEGVFTPPYLRGGEPQSEFFPEEDDLYDNVAPEGGFNYNAGPVL